MGGKKSIGIILALCMVMALSGCGEKLPEMTEEQYNQTVEYAAGLLMRYSNNGQERLIYVDAKELEKQRKKEAEKAEKEAAKQTQTQTQVTPQPQPLPEPTPVETDVPDVQENPEEQEKPVEDTSSAALASSEETSAEEVEETKTTESDPNAITLSSDQTQEIYDDIFLSYQGYMVTSTYPESSKSYVVNADKGKKLLVLRMDLYNGSDSSKSVNMIPLNLNFQILLNGENLGYSSVTFLPNDLSSYSGTIEPRAHESVVVLTQIDEKDAGHIDSLGMIVSIKGQSQSVNLR